jgi:hypothetical protein
MHLKGIRERRWQMIFGVIILATLPCYCLGFGLLRLGGGDPGSAPSPTLTLTQSATAVRNVPQRTRFPTFTPSPTPSLTPTFTLTFTLTPSDTPEPTLTPTTDLPPTATDQPPTPAETAEQETIIPEPTGTQSDP